MMIALYVILATVLGLALFGLLVRGAPNRGYFPLLGPGVVLLGLAGIGMLRLLPIDATDHPVRVLVALGLLWAGWVGLMAFLAQMLLNRMPGTHPWPVLSGAVATLAPVLGFVIAKAVA